MTRALGALRGDALFPAVEARNAEGTRAAAMAVGQANLDLQLQYRPVTEVDLARFDLWSRQLVADSGGPRPDPGHVAGDVAALTRVWDRIAHAVDKPAVRAIEAQLKELRAAAKREDIAKSAVAAKRLRDAVAGLEPAG